MADPVKKLPFEMTDIHSNEVFRLKRKRAFHRYSPIKIGKWSAFLNLFFSRAPCTD